MLSGVRPIHPEIVGWSTAPRGQVINQSLGQVPKKLVSRPARAGKDRIITDPIGYETGWTIARSLGEVGTTSVHFGRTTVEKFNAERRIRCLSTPKPA